VKPVTDADPAHVRRVLVVVCAAIFLETVQFSILAPVLPEIAAEFGLDDVGAGVISGAYAVGLVLLAIPAGRLAARIDERVGIAVALGAMAAATAWFALADVAWQLATARFLAGAACALVWAGGMAWVSSCGPRESRGSRLAVVMTVAITGGLVGPALGTLVTIIGRSEVFLAIAAVSALTVIPVVLLRGSHSVVERNPRGLRALVRGAWLVFAIDFYAGISISAISVMVPLQAVVLGASATAVGIAFTLGSVGQAALSPVAGRVADRRGPMLPMAVALCVVAGLLVIMAMVPGVMGPVVVLVLLLPVAAFLYTPNSVAVDRRASALDLEPAIAFAAWNLLWALGIGLGAVVGPAAAEVVGNPGVYVALAAMAVLLGAIGWRHRTREAGLVPVAPE